MHRLDPSTWPEASYDHHPVDDMEPVEPDLAAIAYREASRRMLRVINVSMGMLQRPKHYEVTWWQVQFALGTIHCEGRSMTDVALTLGVGRAAISKGATELCRMLNIPPSFYMKQEGAQESYRKTRKKQLAA
jgi:hypothetical protein